MGVSEMAYMTCAMSLKAVIGLACAPARLLRLWRHCAISPSPSFIAAAHRRWLLLDGTLPLILVRLSLSFFNKGGPPSTNSQTLLRRTITMVLILINQVRKCLDYLFLLRYT